MKALYVMLLCSLPCVISKGIQDYEITFPERLHHSRHKRDLSTATKDGHEDSAVFALRAFNNKWILDANKNHHLFPEKLAVRQFKSDDSEVITKELPENCLYQGSIRGTQDSTVVLNTCAGLTGLIDDGKDTYHIEPSDDYKETGGHKIYATKDEPEFDAHENCGTQSDEHYSSDSTPRESAISQTIKRLRRSLAVDAEDVYKPYLTTDETRYNEVIFVVDHGIYTRYGNNSETVINRVATLCNAVDAVYQRINVRIVMSAIEIWTNGDRMQRKATGGAELDEFKKYRLAELMVKFHHDNAQFLSHHGWGNVAGMAWVTAMCGSNSAGVNTWSFSSIIGPLVVVAHEMGHNFGFNHNTDSCKCLTPKGCFMGGHKTRTPGFSDCNLISMKKLNDKCLYNVPKKTINPRCGNGIREGDEECDCGTPEICKAKDPCCLPHDCRLKRSSMCSDLHHSCCKDCQFKRQGTLCRAVMTDCDVPEYCTGESRDCPDDSVMQDGIPCNRTNKLLLGNVNYYSVVTRQLYPRIEARYVRISPQYWNGAPCMRTELYGCPSGQVNPTSATPLKAYNDYCIAPKSKSCSPSENSRIVFKDGYQCKEKYMEFRLDASGTLWHHCSGKRVCPDNGSTNNGARLVISSACKDEDSKFVRTTKHSLKHVKSGKCVHPNGGWPGNNRELLLWSSCDVTRLEIWFIKNDCIHPLGIRSKEVPDSHMTASSSSKGNLPHYARLHNSKYWCPSKAKKNEYLQIDLGKTMTINKIAVQGRGNWYDWVTGFFLLYSQNGQRWTGYTESGDPKHSNSYCYSGKCAETHGTQCRDLWGAKTKNAAKSCYNKLNTEAKGYGTCSPTKELPCSQRDVECGQIQCLSESTTPLVKYGKSYKKLTLEDSSQCSAAVLNTTDSVGLGMVADGTKCGDKKICSSNKCKYFAELNIKPCPATNGVQCSGRGVCTDTGVCHCYEGHDPKTGCKTAYRAQDGKFSKWSSWSVCNAGCNGGKQSRHRFCNNPFPKHGGKDCQGDRIEEQDCNTDPCPKAHSCRHLQSISTANKQDLSDGIYDIYPYGLSKRPIKAFCDMSRDGGGWTLLVTSHTNSWTEKNVRLRNADSPSLKNDYSILKYGDDIKGHVNVVGNKFEYRLEAQNQDRWGGIWEADRSYTFTATTNGQTNVQLVKQFDQWNYSDNGIEKRMPWISDAKLTTSKDPNKKWWGTITANDKNYHPAPWINADLSEKQPEFIWYWMREGPWKLPRSCMELQIRGLQTNPLKNGIYTIQPPGQHPVKTYCDFTSQGGGWTLLVTSKTHTGWTADNVRQRNTDKPSLNADYSILGVADAIKDYDASQDFFQYRIEGGGLNQHGGIFDAPKHYTFTSAYDGQTDIRMVENFNGISEKAALVTRMPRLGMSSDIFLSSGSTADGASGSIVYNSGSSDSPTYLPSMPAPRVVRYWMREGTRRSCFDIKIHGSCRSQTYKDDYYLIRLLNDHSYLPVFCDMTSDPGAFTLIVTSRHNSWTRAQVPERNIYRPSLSDDYSILKYADIVKNLGHNSTFMYKLDAHEQGHWGGVWSAPHQYSFMATSNTQTKVTLLKMFDKWTTSWWSGIQNRMPWFNANENTKKALLTTSSSTTYYPSGSIIWGDSQYNPAYWTTSGDMTNPGVIWYWVNEDDCDADRKPVHGGLSEWSVWGKCEKMCDKGAKQQRQRTCTNPAPRCGGRPCEESKLNTEQRSCYLCPQSPIRSYRGYCVQPKDGQCNPAEDTKTWGHALILKKADSDCSSDFMNFLFDEDGIIYHKCSGKIVCPQDHSVSNGKKLLLKSHCPRDLSMHRRLKSKSLQNKKNGMCVHPDGGQPRDGHYLVYWTGCNQQRLELDFFKLPPP